MIHDGLAPVCLFVYKRLETLRNTVASLQENRLARLTDLHIFSDAAARENDASAVAAVRQFVKNIQGFKSVTCYFSETNKRLAQSIIDGCTTVIDAAHKIIVLEDDLVVSPNFLDFMNGALATYGPDASVFAISGYTSPVPAAAGHDVYFTKRSSSWGWATWKSRWQDIDWKVRDYDQFMQDPARQKSFNQMGSDLTGMLAKQLAGKINSWAIRWVYHQFKVNGYTVFPATSKVTNDGFREGSTNTFKTNEARFATSLDSSGQQEFNFEKPYTDHRILKQFTRPYSIKTRAFYKIKALLHL